MEWHKLTVEQIIGGTTPDGNRYLKLFLQDYSKLFNKTSLNASCNNCIADYHQKYTIKVMEKNNDCQYRLLDKYNGIALEPCSNVRVNNGNITDELGAILMQTKGSRIFAKFPQTEPIVEQTETAKEPKRKGRKRGR